MLKIRTAFRALLFSLLAVSALAAPPPGPPARIRDVRVSPAFFNPSAGQKATIAFHAAVAGTARVTILDCDRYPVRKLPEIAVRPGPVQVKWDGRDDRGTVVPDEAWNLRIELGGEVYDPSHHHEPVMEDPQPRTYSRVDGVLSYRLARPARLHIQAGQARPNSKSGRNEGPILRTIVNREPRAAGAVIEKWNGFDESGTIRVSELPHFVVSVLAASLPENAILTRGNRREAFLDYARRTRPPAALVATRRAAATHQHAGLSAFEDRSPDLRVAHSWTRSGSLRLEIEVEGETRAHFVRQPGTLHVYVDEQRVLAVDAPASPSVLTIPADRLRGGEHRIAVNWGSAYGPVAVGTFRIDSAAGHPAAVHSRSRRREVSR
ncbi:MAG TPA: hypothetical protein VFO89_05155 [Thermoanaerobaculia bacterium]|nr:hypothetical protein [Thermoanaerobaculia bacterium]